MRNSVVAKKRSILLVGDVIVFYAALILALAVRYGPTWEEALYKHAMPFSAVLAVGIIIFYAMRLYDVVAGQGPTVWLQSTLAAIFLHLLGAVFFFYFFGRTSGAITPRGTLFLFFAIFSAIFVVWRKFAREFTQKRFGEKALIIGTDFPSRKLEAWLKQHPEGGYEVAGTMDEESTSAEKLQAALKALNITTIIANRKSLEKFAPQLMKLANLEVNFWDLATFYETRLEKIPLGYIDDIWVLQNVIRKGTPLNESVRSLLSRFMACIILLVTLPLWPFIALAVLVLSPGAVFYEQTRIGQRGKVFKLKKFRTMHGDAEAGGPQWASKNDARITGVGKILRATHLDELPQILNIIRGEMSFVGPRPERPEFVRELEQKIPHYNIRHLIKPGFTGWAQLNYPYGSSVEDAAEKLEYDLYYLKYRSLLLDLSIFLKTIRLFFHNPQK